MVTINEIIPMGSRVVTTANMYVDTDATLASGLVDVTKIKKGLSEYQKVVAVGPRCTMVKVGDVVCINPNRFIQRQYKENSLKADIMENQIVRYNFPMVQIKGVDHLMIDEYSDIDFILKDWSSDNKKEEEELK